VEKFIGHRITNLGQHLSQVLSARMITTSSASLHRLPEWSRHLQRHYTIPA